MFNFRFRPNFAVVIISLSGCANWIPSDARIQLNAKSSTFELCDQLAVGTLAPRDVRAEWVMELDRRGATCNTYANDRATKDAQDRAAFNRGVTALSRSMGAQARDSDDSLDSKSAFRGNGMTCYRQGEALRNNSRHCVYNCAGNEVIHTISAVEVCPISLTR